MASVNVYVKQQLQLSKFNFNQTYMFKVGTVALATVKNRVQHGVSGNDAKVKPLNRAYAITKSKLGKRNIRDLTFTGDMMRNFQIRSVSENTAAMNVTTRINRIKASANNKASDPWMVFSEQDKRDIQPALQKIFNEMLQQIVKTSYGYSKPIVNG